METTKSDNELIAEFMGGQPYGNGGSVGKIYRFKDRDEDTDDLLYHASWDWLMPCVAKIRLILQDNDLYFASQKIWNKVTLALATVDIKTVYVVVLEWIKWYNQQTVTPKE